MVRRYSIQNPEDYNRYNRLCGSLRQLAHRLSLLGPEDAFRVRHEALMLDKLHDLGILNANVNASGAGVTGAKLSDVEHKITVSAFARRRLAVVMTRLKMAQTVSVAARFVEQGHVRVGTEVVTDPAFCVTRRMEDWVTWVDSSKIRRNVLRYRGEVDDFDLL